MKARAILLCILLLLLSVPSNLQAQNYRTAEAYIADFGKNEQYITESLVEYSSSLINREKDTRAQATLAVIYKKLENINAIIVKNDNGFGGDTSLRDTFLRMNNGTLMLLNDHTLKLDDFEDQRQLSFDEIFTNFEARKRDIINYYGLIVDYTNAKRRFSRANHLKHVRYFSNRNLFEYDAHQSLMFFKLNVLDAKLSDLLLTTDSANVSQCVTYLNQVCQESLTQIDEYKKVYIDQSLNLANNELITFLTSRNEQLLPLYKDYIQALTDFKNAEKAPDNQNSDAIEKRTALEKQMTDTKTKFNDSLLAMQNQKKILVDNWFKTKQLFLKNNL